MDLGSSKMVIHIVYDTTQAILDDRVKIYKDGSLVQVNQYLGLTQNMTFDLTTADTNPQVLIGNRENGGTWARSFDGIIYYAALYDSALSQADIDTNYAILSVDDDTRVRPGVKVRGGVKFR